MTSNEKSIFHKSKFYKYIMYKGHFNTNELKVDQLDKKRKKKMQSELITKTSNISQNR